ncbi:MAG: LamG domain-containing protein, partial [Candidatus Omnitrophica bacterium]|nr:LamG domain-containing protein [Candidatus Omnitrophota bacterium]
MTADGGDGTFGSRAGGGGGRVAVILTGTGADLMSFTGTMHAYGGLSDVALDEGASGTVYTETAMQGSGNGILTVDNQSRDADTANNVFTTLDDEDANITTVVGSLLVENGGYFVIGADDQLTIGGTLATLTINSGAAFVNEGTLYLGGQGFTAFGTADFSAVGNTVIYTGRDDDVTIGALGGQYYNIYFDNDGTIFRIFVNMDVNGTFNVQAGTFDQNTVDLNVAGNFILDSGAGFDKANAGTLTFDGDLTYADNTSPQQDVGWVVVGQSPDTTTLTTDMTATSLKIMPTDALITDGYEIILSGTMDINGTLNAASGTDGHSLIRVGGIWDMSGGIFTATGSTVMLTGTAATLTITSDSKAFNNLVINGTTGLAGYWKLDESASPAIDYSGHGNSGIWQNDATVSTTEVSGTIRFNNPGSIDLPGSDDYVEIADADVLDLDNAPGITLTAWIYPEGWGESTQGRIVDKGGGAGDEGGWTFHVSDLGGFGLPSEGLGLQLEDGSSNFTFSSNDFVVDLNEWQHVAVTWVDATDTATFYVNGQAVGSEVEAGSAIAAYTDPLRIGLRASDTDRDFDGFIDEVRVYARALSSAEILTMANGNMPGTGLGTYTLQDNLDVNGTLSLNDGTLNTGSDRQINVALNWLNHGGLFVPNNSSVIFDGSTPGNVILSGSQTFYAVDIAAGNPNGGWVLQDDIPASNGLDISLGSVTYADSTIIEPITVVGDTALTGGTFTGTANRFRHDGDLSISSGTYTASTDVTEIDGSFEQTGGTFTNSSATVMFTGTAVETIDTTGGAVFNDLIINDGLIGYWKLDEAVSPSLDVSGFDNSAVWMSNPTFSADVSGTIHFADPGSLNLDGSSDYLDAGDSDKHDITSSFTLSSWVKMSSIPGGYSAIINKATSAYTLEIANGYIYFGFNDGVWRDITDNTTQLQQDTWYHVAGVFDDSADQFILYLNGNIINSAGSITQHPIAQTGNLIIGAANEGVASFFPGLLDDIRIYNRALSLQEITALANGNQPASAIGAYTLQTDLDVDGTLRLNAGTLDVSAANNYQINVGGNWENFGGVFDEQLGSVVFDGADQEIPAAETFYN